ncbi:hypothetical protein [Paracidovorax citrulli]
MAFSAIAANLKSVFTGSALPADDTEKLEKKPVSGTTVASAEATPAESTPAESPDASARSLDEKPGRPVSALRDAQLGLSQELEKLSFSIEQLPEGKRKEEVEKQAADAFELVEAAQKAGENVQRIEEEFANLPYVVPTGQLTKLRKDLNDCLATIHTAVDALATLDTAVEGHCADFPGTGSAVRTAIATVVAALLALALWVVFPPLALVASEAVVIGGLVAVLNLVAEYSERVDRRADCWTAGQAASDCLKTIANRAAELKERQPAFKLEPGRALLPLTPAFPRAADELQRALEEQLGSVPTTRERTDWRKKVQDTVPVGNAHKDVCTVDDKPLEGDVMARMLKAGGGDSDRLDVLMLLLSQAPTNALEELSKTAFSRACRRPDEEKAVILNAAKQREVRIECNSFGVATGGTLFYRECQRPDATSGSGWALAGRNGIDMTPLPDDAALVAEARFTIEGRHIRIEDVSVSASPSLVEAYARS